MLVLEEEIRQLQEKVRKLGEFSSSTSGLFTAGQNYLLASLRGVNVLKHATVHPQTGAYLLRGGVSLLDLQVQGVGDDFQSRLQKMSLAEIEEIFGNQIKAYQYYLQTGQGLVIRSPEELQQLKAIYARYQFLVTAGLPDLDFMTMLENLDPDDKSRIDQMTLLALSQQNISFLQYGPQFSWNYITGSPQDRARLNYLYYRFNQLMAQQPIDWRDPDFANKYYAYIKQTGINPITGNQATPNDKLVAKHYGWVKATSQAAAIIALLAGPLVVSRYSQGKSRVIPTHNASVSTVGRWMSPDEYNKMLKTGRVQMSSNGNTTYVAIPSDKNAFPAAKVGSIYSQFDVPADTVYPAGKSGWGQIPGPGSLISRLNQKKGLPPITEMPKAWNIQIKGKK